jgi:hypothetical protein
MSMEPDHGHSHEHKTGLPWLDLVIAVSVVVISVISLVVSIEHGKTMENLVHENERMVAANTLPFLTLEYSSLDPVTNKPRQSISVVNGGVGPAIVDWLEIRYRGSAYTPVELVKACCASAQRAEAKTGSWWYGNISGSLLPARDRRNLLVATDQADPQTLKAFAGLSGDVTARACYCSVLEECWITDFQAARPKRVKDCAIPAGVKPW